MALAGGVAYLSEPLNYFRYHDTSVRSKSHNDALDVAEELQVTRWILGRVTPKDTILERLCNRRAEFWVPAVLSLSVSWSSKLTILKNIGVIDPHPIRRAVRPALLSIREKFSRHWQSVRSILKAAKL